MNSIGSIFCCAFVATLWGVTNVLIKKTSEGITRRGEIENSNFIKRFLGDIKYLVYNWKFFQVFILNQVASVLFYFLLLNIDLSFIVPVTNSLTFVVTGITGCYLGEELPNNRTIIGTILILVGVSFCLIHQITQGAPKQ